MGNNPWVLPSFKQILIDASDEYVANTDKSKDKPRTALIARVADDIRQAVDGTNDKLPDDLHKVRLILFHSYKSKSQRQCLRLSAHGSETRLPDTPREIAERNPKRIHVAIQPQSGHGVDCPSAEASIRTKSLNYNSVCPVEAKRTSLITNPLFPRSGASFPRRKRRTVKTWQKNGIQLSFRRTCSDGKHLHQHLIMIHHLPPPQTLQEDPIGRCRMDAVHAEQDWGCLLRPYRIHGCRWETILCEVCLFCHCPFLQHLRPSHKV
jgi:hypothetical protein